MNNDEAIKEIKQLKELLDLGILTQDEYDVNSADLKKIILDSEKKVEPLESKKEKEFWEKKAEQKLQAKTLINSKKESEPLREEKKTVNTEDKSIDDEEKEIPVNSQSEEDITVSQDYTQGVSARKFLSYLGIALLIFLTFVFILILAQEYS